MQKRSAKARSIMYEEKVTVCFYCQKEKMLEKRTSLVPREGEFVVIKGKSYSVRDVVWFDDVVEVYCEKTAASASLDEERH